MSDIAEKMRRWQVGELDGFDELIVGDLTDGADEIGRLCSELNMEVVARRKVESDLADWESALQKRNAEIARLREATKKQANMIVDQEAEIERLRGLLREALETYGRPVEWYWRVREALGDD
jgi:septal ring factor EnvC (AmiA/AmiB activator)